MLDLNPLLPTVVLAATLSLSGAARAQTDAGDLADAGDPVDAGDPDGDVVEQDASADAGEGCGQDPACPEGLTCMLVDGQYRCGECELGEERDCEGPCGSGRETCQPDLFFGSCVPEADVECRDGDVLGCEGVCGLGHRVCNPLTCQWSQECVSDRPIDCLPGTTASCELAGGMCLGEMRCNDDCTFGACVEVEECDQCGDGDLDDGEDCDDGNFIVGDGCSPDCSTEEFRSLCDCRSGPGTPGGSGLPLAFVLAAALLCRADRKRPLR